MLTIYHAPGTRSVRPLWLCYELDLPVAVEQVEFSPDYLKSAAWRQISPAGKVPVMIDDGLRMYESGAMVQYILEKYGNGALQPAAGSAERAAYHQWCWFSEATLTRPLGLKLLRTPKEHFGVLVSEAAEKFFAALTMVEAELEKRRFLVDDTFTAADIMMGYAIIIVESALDDNYPHLRQYLNRLTARDAYQRVLQHGL